MKRFLSFALCLCLAACLLSASAMAADNSRSYSFDFTVDGQTQVSAATGDILTFTLVLQRTDSADSANVYSVQAEFEYDDAFLELVEDSVLTASGVEWTDMGRRTGGRAFYMNTVSMNKDGTEWNSRVQMGSFQMRVLGESGATVVDSVNCKAFIQTGMDTFASVDNDVTVVVSTDCTVTFESAGGTEVPAQHVQYGEKIRLPEPPVRSGYTFDGWYTDLDRTNRWDFDNDTVRQNMTLYAKWIEGEAAADGGNDGGILLWIIGGLLLVLLLLLLLLLLRRKKVTFNSRGGTELDSVYVKKGDLLERPMNPVKAGAMFGGWYKDRACMEPWDFDRDEVEKSMTLYARWI